jgi:hypothetical protein
VDDAIVVCASSGTINHKSLRNKLRIIYILFGITSSRFLKKAAQKLLLCWAMGVDADNAHGQN